MVSADSLGAITFNQNDGDNDSKSPFKNLDGFSNFVVDKAAIQTINEQRESHRKRTNKITMTDFRKVGVQKRLLMPHLVNKYEYQAVPRNGSVGRARP